MIILKKKNRKEMLENAGAVSSSGDLFGVVPFDAYVILDFEATCERSKKIKNQEIIEFPIVVVDAKDGKCVTEFQRYVRPVYNPHLSDFCVELTGISQAAVDQANVFPHVWGEVLSFLQQCHLEEGVMAEGEGCENEHSPLRVSSASQRRRYCIVCCGDWDLLTMFPQQLNLSRRLLEDSLGNSLLHGKEAFTTPAGVEEIETNEAQDYLPAKESLREVEHLQRILNTVPPSWFSWCNVKHFVSMASTRAVLSSKLGKAIPDHFSGMMELLKLFRLPLMGREHSGIDDCRNIASVVCELLKYHCPPHPTRSRKKSLDIRGLPPLYCFSFPSYTKQCSETDGADLKSSSSYASYSGGEGYLDESRIPAHAQPHQGLYGRNSFSWPLSSLNPCTLIKSNSERIEIQRQVIASSVSCDMEFSVEADEHRKIKHLKTEVSSFSPCTSTLSGITLSSTTTNMRREAGNCNASLSPRSLSSSQRLCSVSHQDGFAASDSVNRDSSLVYSDLNVCTQWDVVSAALEAYKSPALKESIEKKGKTQRPLHSVQLSKFMSYILRHGAIKKNIPISKNGFVRLDHLIHAPGFPLGAESFPETVVSIAKVVRDCPKKRFLLGVVANNERRSSTTCSMSSGECDQQKSSSEGSAIPSPPLLYIAAAQGHSFEDVRVHLKRVCSAEEAPVAVHGTNFNAWKKIRSDGYLSSMSRQYIHFAKGLPSEKNVKSGMRSSSTVFIYLNVPKVLKFDSNVALLESENGVFLTSGEGDSGKLPLHFILRVVDRDGTVLFSNP